MKSIMRVLLTVTLLLGSISIANAQQATSSTTPVVKARMGISTYIPGPLMLSSGISTPITALQYGRIFTSSNPPLTPQYGWRRSDWEFGRAWLGSVLGFFYGWLGDLIIHYEGDFSKANWLLNEGPDGQVANGEVVYNIVLYCGLSPLYAKYGIQAVSPVKGNSTGSYLLGLAGSLIGMVYWTKVDELYSLQGFAVFTGLTTLGTFLGHRIF